MDKASVLVYCDIRNKEGVIVRCETCFSVVYDVMVACTSIYRESEGGKSKSHSLMNSLVDMVNRSQGRRAHHQAYVHVLSKRSKISYASASFQPLQSRCPQPN
jgi:hypothetical protein